MVAEIEIMHASVAESMESEIVPLLRQQASMFAKLERFALQQRMLVEQEDTRPLLELLAQRQKLSSDLAQVSQRLAPVRQGWTVFRERLCAGDRDEADALLDQMRLSLSRVIESDEQDARSLAVRKQLVRRDLNNSRAMGAAACAYGTRPVPTGHRLDEEL